MDAVFRIVLSILSYVLHVYSWVVILSVALQLLMTYGIVNPWHKAVRVAGTVLHRVTSPALRPIQRVVPLCAGIDFSPAILLFILWVARLILGAFLWSRPFV